MLNVIISNVVSKIMQTSIKMKKNNQNKKKESKTKLNKHGKVTKTIKKINQ